MDFFQEGLFHKKVSSAQVENMVSWFDRGFQSVLSDSSLEWNLKDINRMRLSIRKLKEELRYVLKEQGIPIVSVEAFRHVFNDDVVPTDTTPEMSSDTDWSSVREFNVPLPTVNELNELIKSNSGEVINRILDLLFKINSLRLRIAKMETDSKNKEAMHKDFQQKIKQDPQTYESIKSQLIAISEIRGYVNALVALVEAYPDVSTTDQAIRSTTEQFDLMCWKWHRYTSKLRSLLEDYLERFYSMLTEPLKSDSSIEYWLDEEKVSFQDIERLASKKAGLVFNKKTLKTQIQTKNEEGLIKAMKDVIDDSYVYPKHYTGVPDKKDVIYANLAALSIMAGLVFNDVEMRLEEWSGGKSKATSNPAVARVLDRARQMVASPLKAAVTSPLRRDVYLAKTLIDFNNVSNQIKSVKQILESAPEVLRDKLASGLEKLSFKKGVSRELLTKILIRRSVPSKDNMKKVKPVEDAVRERVRKRYGPNIPFEDEVNVGTEDKPVFVKETLATQDLKTGKWILKTDEAVKALYGFIDPTEIASTDS